MGKAAFAAGVLGTLAAGLFLSSRLEHRDYTGTLVNKVGGHTTCPTFWVNWDKAPDLLPEGVLRCGCAVQAVPEGGGSPLHPPRDVHDAAAPMDGITVSYTEFTPPGGTKKVGLSYVLRRGMDQQRFVISPSSDPYLSFALFSAIPLLGGVVLGILLGFLPRKKAGFQ